MTEDVTDLTRGVYRRIYDGFITGQRISKLSLQAEAWFWRILVTVDDFGNGRADPELCRYKTAGSRTRVSAKQVSGWLREMRDVGLIQFYAAKGEPFLHIIGFEDSQPAGKNGKRLKRFPTPDDSEGIRVNPDLSSASEITNDTENTNEDKSRSKPALVRQIFDFWKTEMGHPKAQLTAERKRKIEERLDDSTVEEIEAAVRGCKASDFHMGREPGHPDKFDDIELICRKRSKLESFISKCPKPRAMSAPRMETVESRLRRESCERCHATGTEIIPGKGARVCDHGTGNSQSSNTVVECPPQDREARVS